MKYVAVVDRRDGTRAYVSRACISREDAASEAFVDFPHLDEVQTYLARSDGKRSDNRNPIWIHR